MKRDPHWEIHGPLIRWLIFLGVIAMVVGIFWHRAAPACLGILAACVFTGWKEYRDYNKRVSRHKLGAKRQFSWRKR